MLQILSTSNETSTGPELVQNGDFSELGADLITNGDFSDVPLGSELNVFPSSEAGVGNHFRFVDYGNNTIAYDGSGVTTITYVDDDRGGLHYFKDSYNLNTPTLTQGKTYQIKITCKVNLGTYGIQTGSPIGGYNVTGLSNTDYVTHTINAFVTDSTSGNWLRIDELSSGQIISINDVSVKEQINLVTNPNFTNTGIELVDNNDFSNGTADWSADGGSTISVGTHEGRINVADINITGTSTGNRISHSFSWTEGSSYKVTCEVYVVSGSFRIDTADSLYNGDFVSSNTLGEWQTLTGYITSNTTGYQDFWLRSMLDGATGEVSQFYVDSVSIKELGEDWSEIVSDPDSVSFVENGVKIVQGSDVGLDNRVFQGSVTEDDKSYKVTYTIHSISLTSGNSVKYYNGTAYVVLPEQ